MASVFPSGQIPPALSAQEWAGALEYIIVTRSKGEIGGETRTKQAASDHANAALHNAALPDGDPRKWTRADRTAVLAAAIVFGAESENDVYGDETRAAHARRAEHLRLIAARIAAILPPREVEGRRE